MNMYNYFISFFNIISKGKNICFELKILSEDKIKLEDYLKYAFRNNPTY